MTDLAAILDAFADGSCPQGVLADFLEGRGDERAERVRNERPHTEEWDATHLGDSHPTYVDIEEDPDSFRGRILRWFPEYFVIHVGDPVALCPDGRSVRKARPNDTPIGVATASSDGRGQVPVFCNGVHISIPPV
jgi:hypothetical protein